MINPPLGQMDAKCAGTQRGHHLFQNPEKYAYSEHKSSSLLKSTGQKADDWKEILGK